MPDTYAMRISSRLHGLWCPRGVEAHAAVLHLALGTWHLALGTWHLVVGGGRWAVGGGRWAVGGGRWAVGGGRWAVGGGRNLRRVAAVGASVLSSRERNDQVSDTE
ncbi:hypothetical protein GGD41_002303 [Paraburkholderia bryophila]|uniref:Uncharacterized protein n=1 Tax=Paraburkholderia bryophila TaxID=420952 RepID=A0A7Y9W727_9BURK|nr:hypothetical protein [Paraburkholderia bryophila]